MVYGKEELKTMSLEELTKLKRRIELLLEQDSDFKDRYQQAYHEVKIELKNRR